MHTGMIQQRAAQRVTHHVVGCRIQREACKMGSGNTFLKIGHAKMADRRRVDEDLAQHHKKDREQQKPGGEPEPTPARNVSDAFFHRPTIENLAKFGHEKRRPAKTGRRHQWRGLGLHLLLRGARALGGAGIAALLRFTGVARGNLNASRAADVGGSRRQGDRGGGKGGNAECHCGLFHVHNI
jgi:hypothetical protein